MRIPMSWLRESGYHPLLLWSVVAALVLPTPLTASADGLFNALSAESRATLAEIPSISDPTIVRMRHQDLDFAYLLAHVTRLERDPSAPISMTVVLFDDVALTIVLERIEGAPPEHFQILGRIDGVASSQVSFIVKNGCMVGTIRLEGKRYQIYPLGGKLHAIVDINGSDFPGDLPEDDLNDLFPPP